MTLKFKKMQNFMSHLFGTIELTELLPVKILIM